MLFLDQYHMPMCAIVMREENSITDIRPCNPTLVKMLNSFVIALFPNTGLLQTFTIPLTACGDNERGISYFHPNETPESIIDLIQVLSIRDRRQLICRLRD